jgi:capsular polysaccharide biosynthesis protein
VLVDVFIARDSGLSCSELLVLKNERNPMFGINKRRWRFYGTLDSQSVLFEGCAVELHLQARGFIVVRPRTSCAQS